MAIVALVLAACGGQPTRSTTNSIVTATQVATSDPNVLATQTRALELTQVAAALAPTATSAATAAAPTNTATLVPTALPPTVAATATATVMPSPTFPRAPLPTIGPTSTRVPPTAVPQPMPSTPVTIEGRGQQASQPVKLNAGLVTVNSSHTGSGNFIVQLIDSKAATVALVANVIGSVASSTAFRVPADGDYIANVIAAGGTWKLTIQPIGAVELGFAVGLPQRFEGRSNQNTPLIIATAGALRVVGKHSGQGNFIVQVLDSQGRSVGLAANAIGNAETSQIVRIPTNGVYVLVVQAGGDWTIEVTQ